MRGKEIYTAGIICYGELGAGEAYQRGINLFRDIMINYSYRDIATLRCYFIESDAYYKLFYYKRRYIWIRKLYSGMYKLFRPKNE